MRIGLNGWFWEQRSTGSSQYLHYLLHHLVEVAPQNEYIVYTPGTFKPALDRGLSHVQVVTLLSPFDNLSENLTKVWFEQFAFPRACRRDKVDIMHVPYWGSPHYTTLPTVVTVHDLIPMLLVSYRGSILVRTYTKLVSMAAKRADVIITDSQASRRDIVNYLKPKGKEVIAIPLAVEETFHPIRDEQRLQAIRDRYNLPERFLLYLGGFDQRKNVVTLIQAYQAILTAPEQPAGNGDDVVAPETKQVALVIAGKLPAQPSRFFPDPRQIAAEFDLGNRVQFIGWIDEEDKPTLYTLAEALIFPSLYEGFGLPVLEAMACGTPIIAANTTSLPELVGEAGILVAPRDAVELAEAMIAILEDRALHQALSEEARHRAGIFTWRQVAEATLATYEKATAHFAAKDEDQ